MPFLEYELRALAPDSGIDSGASKVGGAGATANGVGIGSCSVGSSVGAAAAAAAVGTAMGTHEGVAARAAGNMPH